MASTFSVKLLPRSVYYKHASSNYTLFVLEFHIQVEGEDKLFISECSDSDIQDIIKEADEFEMGNQEPGNLFFPIPWIAGNFIVYPFSFYVHTADCDPCKYWTFRYRRNQNDKDFDFQCDLSRDQVIQLRDSLREQFEAFDFSTYGKASLYTFQFQDKPYEWCYSGSSFGNMLNSLCRRHQVVHSFIDANNYTDPLRFSGKLEKYGLNSSLLIQFDNAVLDLVVLSLGLVKYRVFKNDEFSIVGPSCAFIDSSVKQFCECSDLFDNGFTGISVTGVQVESTDYLPWVPKGFEEDRIQDPIDLPEKITFYFENGQKFSVFGVIEDEFFMSTK